MYSQVHRRKGYTFYIKKNLIWANRSERYVGGQHFHRRSLRAKVYIDKLLALSDPDFLHYYMEQEVYFIDMAGKIRLLWAYIIIFEVLLLSSLAQLFGNNSVKI